MGAVEQHLPAGDLDQFQASGPANGCVTDPACPLPDGGNPRRLESVQGRVGDCGVGRLVSPPQADTHQPKPP